MATRANVLVIEDDPMMRDVLAEWLAAAGYSVRTAKDGCAGLEAVRAAEPALVVTDIHMPGTGGATVIVELKHRHPEIPVIAISGLFCSGHGMDAEAAISLGAARALAKPFKRAQLLEAVSELLGRAAAGDRDARPLADADPAGCAPVSVAAPIAQPVRIK